MSGHEGLERAIELALRNLGNGPPLGAFGIAREDCALAHIDYFASVQGASMVLCQALAEVRGTTADEIHREFSPPDRPCDCPSCVGREKAERACQEHREAYTNVKEWRS